MDMYGRVYMELNITLHAVGIELRKMNFPFKLAV